MRILYWTPFFLPDPGGIETLSARLLPALRQRGCEFAVVTSHGRHELPDDTEYAGIPVHRFHFREAIQKHDLAQISRILQKVSRLKQAFKPSLVHLHVSDPSAFFHLHTRQACPGRTILTLHQNPDYYGLQIGASDDALLAKTLGAADWVTAVSQSILDKLRRAVPALTPRSSVIYNGIAAAGISADPLPFDPPQLLGLGRLIPRKGFDLALAAFAVLLNRQANARLVLAGDGIARSDLERQAAALRLGGRVRFLGAVEPEQVPRLLNQSTVVMIPSRAEGMPMVALEAARLSRPVVATMFDGIDELVVHGETGLIVSRDDIQALAAALAHLLAHPGTAARLGRNARLRVQDVFGLDKTADSYADLYQRLLESARDAAAAPCP